MSKMAKNIDAFQEKEKIKTATNEQDGEVGQGEAEEEIVGRGVHALVPGL